MRKYHIFETKRHRHEREMSNARRKRYYQRHEAVKQQQKEEDERPTNTPQTEAVEPDIEEFLL